MTDFKTCGRGRMTMLRIQYISAMAKPAPAMIGRKTNGGLRMRSSPLRLEGGGAAVAATIGVGDGVGSGDGVGEGDGVGVGTCSVKLAQGDGGALAHSRCRPGGSAGKGLTFHVKFPFASALTAPETLFGWSQ